MCGDSGKKWNLWDILAQCSHADDYHGPSRTGMCAGLRVAVAKHEGCLQERIMTR